MIMISGKKVKTKSSLCNIVCKSDKEQANQNIVGQRRCFSLSALTFEFRKPRWSSREAKKRPLATLHQPDKIQPILKSMNKLTLQDWIMNSPTLNVQYSGRVHPAYEEKIHEVTSPNILPIDNLCMERLKSKNDDIMEEDSSLKTIQGGVKRNKKVSFRLPEVADIFLMDSADGYYYSKKTSM